MSAQSFIARKDFALSAATCAEDRLLIIEQALEGLRLFKETDATQRARLHFIEERARIVSEISTDDVQYDDAPSDSCDPEPFSSQYDDNYADWLDYQLAEESLHEQAISRSVAIFI